MKKITKIIGVSLMFILSLSMSNFGWAEQVTAQAPSSSGSGGGGGTVTLPVPVVTPSAVLPLDLMSLTNRAALASLAVRHIDTLVVIVTDAADVQLGNQNQGGQRFIMDFTDPVKSWQSMVDMVENHTFGLSVMDPKKPAYVSVVFYQGTPPANNYGGDYNASQALFYGNNQTGHLVLNQFGAYELDSNSSKVVMSLNQSLRMVLPGLIAGKAIMDAESDWPYAQNLNVDSNTGEFSLPVRAVGSGALVLFGKFDGQYQTIAFSLVTGQVVPISNVWIRLLLEDSQEIFSFVDPQNVHVRIQSWAGHGINPLIIVKNTIDQKGGLPRLTLDVSTTEGLVPTGYTIIDISTGASAYVAVPDGLVSVFVDLQIGEYHIIPHLALKGTDGGGGGKGG